MFVIISRFTLINRTILSPIQLSHFLWGVASDRPAWVWRLSAICSCCPRRRQQPCSLACRVILASCEDLEMHPSHFILRWFIVVHCSLCLSRSSSSLMTVTDRKASCGISSVRSVFCPDSPRWSSLVFTEQDTCRADINLVVV